MSILTKPYEISVWEDVWNGEKFVEKRLGVIGSSAMSAQCRVFSPNLTQKTNGTKELSFQLYKRYIDNITGKEVNNPFYDWLVNERKVKLQYDGKWYDFIIKNIQENSSTYQYTYKLEDALVQELSKNGFNAEFDDSQMNNSGTASELAKKVLVETDWGVSENSEAFVEGIEEALIYLRTKSALKAYQVIDQDVNNLKEGVTVSPNEVIIPEGKVVLAFYSSCVDKPYRFQFIYVDELSKLTKDDNRLITNKNCQYFIDNPEYGEPTELNKFYLPNGLDTTTIKNEIVSGDYRAKRYGFAQESIFVPVLNRYVNVYEKDNKEYYGYLNTNYVSPTLIQNYISNTQFKNTSGWTGTRFISGISAKVENVTGRFQGNGFINVIDDIANISEYTHSAYMKLTIGAKYSLVLNSGPRDNRLSIGRIEDGEEWALVYKAYNKNGEPTSLNFDLDEYTYISKSGTEYDFYEKVTTNRKLHFYKPVISEQDANVNVLFTAVHDVNNLTEKWFKKNSEIRLAITAAEGEYYIESISLFKVVRDSEGKIILPENQAENIANQVIDTNYYFFAKDDIKDKTNEDELAAPVVLKEMDYKQFTPKMIEGAQKIRTIQGKESNYFNLLQSIAEKFEAWLDFEITRDEWGAVTGKKIVFRNYLGKTNHVGFKYGVNLKDIQRTFESKQIVTKLIVKDNSNEFANNGFCSIAKASANPTGENYVYDFQYFFNRGMLNAKDYLNTLYVYNGASGDDIPEGGKPNLKGYFPRIKAINQQIDARNDIIINLSKDITSLSAKFQVAQAGYEAAQGGLEQCNYDFQATVPTDKSIPEYLAKYAEYIEKAEIAEIAVIADTIKRTDVKKILQEYTTYQLESDKYEKEYKTLEVYLSDVQGEYNTLTEEVTKLGEQKVALNKLFFSTYSRYIQEGTWIEESYVDDNKYYADSLSVMYNSCYPKASYTINVLNISKLPGYEGLSYGLGDKTYIEDSDFFGSDQRVEIVVTEISENLDDPSQDKIKVQTFKNQFQDLFQKITASVQSTQLNEGSSEKAVALAEAGQERKNEFVTDALAGAGARLQLAGQQSVTFGDDGLTIIDVDSPSNSIRMIGGAILLSKQDKNGQTKWTTGLTSDGITADLITAGILNVGEISIMNHDEPVFRWDSFGISAFDAVWTDAQGTPVISSINTDKFVRFDKFGIYGIDGGVNGMNWYPTGASYNGKPMDEINALATFSLTWDGLHVTHGDASVHIGLRKKENKNVDSLILITNKGKGKDTFCVNSDGDVTISGTITADKGHIGGETGWNIEQASLWSSVDKEELRGSFYINSADNDSNNWICAYDGPDGPDGTGELKFLVGKNGLLYAQDATIIGTITADEGRIGDCIITKGHFSVKASNIEFSSGDIGGTNLLLNSSFTKDLGGWYDYAGNTQIVTKDGTACARIVGEFNKTKYVNQSFLDKIDITNLDQQYVYSAEVRIDNYQAGTTNPFVALYIDGYYDNNGTSTWFAPVVVKADDIISSHSNKGWVKKTYRFTIPDLPGPITSIRTYLFGRDFTGDLYFKNLKLEKGCVATAWSPAPEDQVSANQTSGAMKWKMTPSACIWWNDLAGTNSESSPLMKLDSTGLMIKGAVHATSGKIGGNANGQHYWDINAYGIYQNQTSGQYTGMMSNGRKIKDGAGAAQGYVKFYAGGSYTMEDTDQASSYASVLANFVVTDTGYLYAENADIAGKITANEGYIGTNQNLRLNANGIYGSIEGDPNNFYWALTRNEFYLNANASINLGGNFSLKNTSLGGEIKVNGPFYIGTKGDVGFSFSPSNEVQTDTITATVVISRYWRNHYGFYIKLNKKADKDYTFIVKYRTSQQGSGNGEVNFSPDSGYGIAAVTVPGGSDESELVKEMRTTSFHYLYLQASCSDSNTELNINKANVSGQFSEEGDTYKAGTLTINTRVMSGTVLVTGNLVPTSTEYTLGAEGQGWKQIYIDSSPMTISDRNVKNSIENLEDSYETFFNNLRPVRYKFNKNDSNRYHVGFISQEVEEALAIANIPTTDFAGFISYHKEDGQLGYGLRYEEFIALNTSEILKLKARINLLEEKISQLEKT